MSTNIISFREFARRLNFGEKTIRDSIKRGLITKGVIISGGKSKIDFLIAYNEVVVNNVGRNCPINKILAEINALSIAINKTTEKTALRLSELQKQADQFRLAVPKEPIKILLPTINKSIK